MSKKLGRPFEHNVNVELMRQMQIKGFTAKEVCSYFNLPYDTMRWYARKNNIPRFKNDKGSKIDERILIYLETEHLTMTKTAELLNTTQPYISRRYKIIKEKRKAKEERFEWLKNLEDVEDVAEN